MATRKRRRTKFQELQRKKGLFCQGKTNKADVKAAADVYVADAVKKGKTKAEARKTANRVLRGGCSTSSVITGTKKKRKKRR